MKTKILARKWCLYCLLIYIPPSLRTRIFFLQTLYAFRYLVVRSVGCCHAWGGWAELTLTCQWTCRQAKRQYNEAPKKSTSGPARAAACDMLRVRHSLQPRVILTSFHHISQFPEPPSSVARAVLFSVSRNVSEAIHDFAKFLRKWCDLFC